VLDYWETSSYKQTSTVLPDGIKTMNELINLLVDKKIFENDGNVHPFLRKNYAHKLTAKGRFWQLAQGRLNLRFPDRDISQFETEDGGLVFDWLTHNDDFVIALMDNGMEEVGSVLGMSKQISILILFCSQSILDLPKRDRTTNRCVRTHLETSPAVDLRTYEIVYIRDIESPDDAKVGDEDFHRDNFEPRKHNLVVKLRVLHDNVFA